jgi:hypothetical protein
MAAVLKADQKSRVCISRENIRRYGERFIAVALPEGILLKPVPRDPIKTLGKYGKKFKGQSIAEIRKEAHEEAMKEVE